MQLDAFGVASVERGNAQDCPWRWPGQYEDRETGLYWNWHRAFDAQQGRYVSEDPMGLRGGVSLYGYVDDPLTWMDPWGLSQSKGCGAAGGAARAAGGGTTTLYRAVSEAEFQQLMRTGRFAQGPNLLGGKFFDESAADAAKWRERLQGAGNYRIISAELPTSTANQLMRWERLDAIGPARYGEFEQLTEAIIRSVP